MGLSPNTGAQITLEEATALTTAYRTAYPREIKAFFIGANRLKEILDQKDCIGIRIYHGFDVGNNCMKDLLVGVNSKECDMTELIMDRMSPCPNICDVTSPLT